MTPPLVVDIDGTMTRAPAAPRSRGLDPRVFDVLPNWKAPIVIATGKAFPYPVALSGFLGLPERIIAENGGIALADGELRYAGDPERVAAAIDDYRAAGYDLGWGKADTVNRWRETEIAVSLDAPEEPLRRCAADHGLTVVDSGYAYHVMDGSVDKADGLRAVCEVLGREPAEFVAIGDSENDVPTFKAVGQSFAVANADEKARNAADAVTDSAAASGLLEALDSLQ